MIWLKQSTAGQEIPLGYFLDNSDGDSEELALSIANTDIKIWKTGATTLANKNSGGATHISNGVYYATLDATDSNTLGPMAIFVHVTGALTVRLECLVLPANVYDSLVAGTDNLDVNTMQWLGTSCAAPSVAGVPEVDITHVSGSVQDISTETKQDVIDGVVDTIVGHTVEIGTAGAGLTNINLPNQTMDITGNITGNLSGSVGSVTGAVGSVTGAVGSVTSEVTADAIKISGSTTAADTLQSQYDGTGLTGDTYPATQSQLSGIANVGSAVKTSATSGTTVTTGTETLTYTSTMALDGTRHEIDDDAGTIEMYYEFDVGSGIPSNATLTGYLSGSNDSLDVYGYDWVATSWVQIGTLSGENNTIDKIYAWDLFTSMVGTGANLGVVRIRFNDAGLTSATFAVDQVFCSFSQGSSSYDNGAVWIDTNASNTNTVAGIDGVSTNPVSTVAAANTLAAALNLHKFEVAPNSSITLAASQQNESFSGDAWTLALGGQDIAGTVFRGATVSGVATGATPPHFEHCRLGTVTLPPCRINGTTGFTGTLTVGSAGDFFIIQCASLIAGAGSPTIDCGAGIGPSNFNVRDWSGGVAFYPMLKLER